MPDFFLKIISQLLVVMGSTRLESWLKKWTSKKSSSLSLADSLNATRKKMSLSERLEQMAREERETTRHLRIPW